MNTNTNVLIWSGGKCGSSTLYNTFLFYGYKAIHMHSINELKLRNSNIFQNIFNINDLFNSLEHDNIFIIDSYRTPIERNISSFFENFYQYFDKYELNDNVEINSLIYIFNKHFINVENYHPMDDFEQYNIEKFDFKNKYIFKKYKSNNKNIFLLKIRFNDIQMWNQILSNVFNHKINVESLNVSDEKKYINIYNKFKKSYLVPIKHLDYIKNNIIFNKYNTDDEKNKYLKYWKKKSYIDNRYFLNKIDINKFKNIKKNFNLEYYKKNYFDLKFDYDEEYYIHYEFYGFYEKRICDELI